MAHPPCKRIDLRVAPLVDPVGATFSFFAGRGPVAVSRWSLLKPKLEVADRTKPEDEE